MVAAGITLRHRWMYTEFAYDCRKSWLKKEFGKNGNFYKLDNFEGPLDLLLHLIEKNKVSIYDIPIVLITEQYLEYVNQMDHEDLDVVSDFLVMAATLLDIKSRMLLPKVERRGRRRGRSARRAGALADGI